MTDRLGQSGLAPRIGRLIAELGFPPESSIRNYFLTGLPGLQLTEAKKLYSIYQRYGELKYLPKMLLLMNAATVLSIFSERQSYQFEANQPDFSNPPLFILGHWRSGTTFLHELLACDPQFIAPTLHQATFPQNFSSRKAMGLVADRVLPDRRPHDNMPMHLDSPWEDETALFSMTLISSIMGNLFPNNYKEFLKYISLEGIERHQLLAWSAAMTAFVKKLQVGMDKRPLLKSPAHTARLHVLKDLYPTATYVHIHRHPDEVFSSTLKMQSHFSASVQLQTPEPGMMENMVLDYYKEVHSSYFKYRGEIPPENLIEIGYQDLKANPIKTLEKIYSALSLQAFDEAVPYIEAFLIARSGHKHRCYTPLAPRVREMLRREWKTVFDEWDYQ